MCEALRELMKDELAEERREGMKMGAFENAVLLIRNLMENTGVTAEKAMENLGISAADRSKYMAKL